MGRSSPSSSDAFEAVSFLAGSPNRVAVLAALAALGPCSRPDLVDAVGVSRVTVGRILDDCSARGWVTREGGRCRITPVGEAVCDSFGSLVRTVESMDRLAAVHPWLPADFDVDADRLVSARITVPTWSDSIAPVRRSVECCRGLDVLCLAASSVAPDFVRAVRDAAVVDEATADVVFTAEALDVARADPTMRGWFADFVEAGGRVYEHPGHPYLVGLCDETAVIGMNDNVGAPRGLIESDDFAVVAWVDSRFDCCRDEADPVDADMFTP